MVRRKLTSDLLGRHIYLFGHEASCTTTVRRLADAGAQEGTVVLSEGEGSRFSAAALFRPVLSFSAIVFFIGLAGVLVRRNIIIVLMCIELMLNAVNLTFVTFSHMLNQMSGQMSVFFIITVAAAESAVGLGLIIAMFRTLRSVDTDQIRLLRE